MKLLKRLLQLQKHKQKDKLLLLPPEFSTISTDSVKRIIFACDAGMGSSAMGASLLRNKIQKAGFENIPVTNQAISTLEDTDYTLIVTQGRISRPRCTTYTKSYSRSR